MRRSWYNSQLLVVCLLAMLLSLGFFPRVQAEIAVLPEYKKVINIASADSRPPYILPEDRSGLELDIIRSAFADQGIEVNFQFSSRNRQMLHFEQHKVDAIITVNQYSGVSGFFSDNYISYQNVAISLAKDDLRIKNIDDLVGLSVVAFLNANNVLGDAFHQMTKKNLSYLEVSPQQKQNKMLYLQRVDVVIADKNVFQYLNTLIARDVDVSENLHYHMIFPASDYFASFHDEKLKNSFNQGLKNIRNNGVYQQLQQKYIATVH
ncbi:substrate-binding periplasmic protein [Shewanella subflava]|uniref:Transporter substrate-binding domain-containing protein n=1 Tax=Shewanella subflava TaxID=2986476 RepID=A0ABT3I4L4_9GAMM|nr:transporter substrate-binding domain-containing protein [Shewanella subflava]MCW3170952.1 transporter substrate-binding domain-containing protein [Shewanella subflava]